MKRGYWQFKNGTVAEFDSNGRYLEAILNPDNFIAWDRSLGGYVIYAKR